MKKMVECSHYNECASKGAKCEICKNNTKRNVEVDYFQKANDNPIPEACPRLTYNGPAEQTAGYKCPVCGEYTNPYAMRDCRCGSCGYKLNVGR